MTTMIDDVDAIELRGVRSRFAGVVADWRLTQGEVRSLLGLDGEGVLTEVLPAALDRSTETRIRLLIDLERRLCAVMDDEAAAAWLRRPNPSFDGLSPLAAASADVACLRGMRDVLTAARRVVA